MKRFNYIILFFTLFFIACEQEEFLTKTNKNGLNSDTFMTSEKQAIEAVNAIYDPLNHKGLYRYGFIVLGEAPSDNVINPWADGRTGPDVKALHDFIWNDTNQFFWLRWSGCYKGIYRANYVLENLDKVNNSTPEKINELRGQALFLRALYYYNLVSGFGDVPLVTSILTSDESNNISTSPAAEVWNQIDSDLDQAASLLPSSYSKDETGRATKGAAFGLLSRVRLWTKDYAGAASAAAQLDNLGYQLVSIDDYIKMYDGRMENSSESVFETQLVYGFKAYWSDENGETSNLMSMFPRISWAQYLRPRKTDSYDIVNMLFEAGDGRREGSILISGQDQIYYHKADKVSVFPDTSIYKDWRLDVLVPGAYQTRKFLPYDATYWTKGGRFFDNGVSINVPVIRYAEVILNRAEALAENDQLAEAWTQLERIRTRAGLSMDGISNANKTALLDQIKKDRRIELIFEGHRWGDLKRWGELSTLNSAGLNYSGQVDWPIPAQEKAINPNL
tara:strand:- start:767 stop:2281 length:1515 start_codon:yes stop_codon:yes gene_type:complete